MLALDEVDPKCAATLVEADRVLALNEVDTKCEVGPVLALVEVDPVAALVEIERKCAATLGQAGTVQGSFSRSVLVVPLSLCSLISPTIPLRPCRRGLPRVFSTANKGEGLGVIKF